ncbi:hypothetical protein BJ912DRAFT_941110 [Pholiota molesta]|nr:hypothetical protein BJ912DRAFT_941110 [Pholiota molesta]
MAAFTSSMQTEDSGIQADFRKLKVVCVPLLGASRLTPASVSATSRLLEDLIKILNEIPSENLTSNLISYVFLPLSTILQRNSSAEIPDQILEKILIAFKLLVESWWWTCDSRYGSRSLCSAKPHGKGKSRDDETKVAALRCLVALLRPRTSEEALKRSLAPTEAEDRFLEFQEHTQSPKFIPIIGQTLDSVMTAASSRSISLQSSSLEVILFLLDLYLPDPLIPSVLPGVVSTMTKVCLALPQGKGWANGEVVSRGLKAIGDEVCIKHGVLRRSPTESKSSPPETKPFGTRRTESWLRGTATHLTPLLTHPTPAALQAVSTFSASLISSTTLTLPQTQPLLLSFLLSLSLSDYPSVSSQARQSLTNLLTTPSDAQISLQHTLMANLSDNLSALPRLLSTQFDAKVAHVAGLIDAVCRLASIEDSGAELSVVSKGIGKLLGPTGGIEKWGWSLLSVLEFVEPPVIVTTTSGAQLALENNPESSDWISFPELVFKNISSPETRDSLTSMFHSLGKAGGDTALFAVDWFVSLGSTGSSATLLEGITSISLFGDRNAAIPNTQFSKRLDKQARTLAKNIAEIWDQPDPSFSTEKEKLPNRDEDTFLVQHQTGIIPLHDTLKITQPSSTKPSKPTHQPIIHRALCLQLITVTSGISQGRFSSLFIHTLYPVLHSLVSPVSFLSSTALAALNFITIATSYASPANLLLSNFDYILDSISRRLSQRWLDIDASKVLGVMVRLAGDVVEECFDRLDEFHGYSIIVDGLIEVLTEVIKVIEVEAGTDAADTATSPKKSTIGPQKAFLDDFFAFLPRRAAAGLVEALSKYVGDFMFRRVWDDVWPRFRLMLLDLERGEKANALTRSDGRATGSESAYTHSHRLYRSLLKTMTFALKGVHEHEPSFWEVIMSFRRFLAALAQEELQKCAIDLYVQAGKVNPDAVWLLLVSTMNPHNPIVNFMAKPMWNIDKNAAVILQTLE